MDSDLGKLFIGGISWETDEEKLKEYFNGYGEVVQAVVMRDKITGKPRGFGFVVFADPNVVDRVLQDTHVIDGRTVEAKRALSREEQQVSRVGNSGGARNVGGAGSTRTKKIFVGGLPPTLNEEGFRQYFEAYGTVTDVVIMYDQQTNRPRGFGFVSFDSEQAVDRVLHKTFHDLYGKQVEVKRALPKDANPGGAGRSMGGGGSGGYQGYGSSAGNLGSYDGRMESSRYMHSQNAGGGFPSYGSSGYNAPGYGYGPANNGMGYGYGNYGGANPGYGGPAGGYGNPNAPNAGFGGPGGGGYGNPNVPNAGYGGPPNTQRNSWGAQAPSGYGYGSSQWGAPGGAGGPGTGQSPSGLSGYGNQGYGYGGYGGGSDGAYGNQSAYGAVGGRSGISPSGNTPAGDLHSGTGGYMGGGYGDGTGNSGYGNSGWRSDPSQVSGNYGGGYGSGSTRQAQQ
ncbi:heterogeneous nuclear ribonucleoprotein 1-like [Andrographis paniculata]|uniref:heterogeneous nuclear ribonucleoprotein 1-like n=1 Tax=Andrographis paniculata TaxID=175694 RepID=UPI0021E86A8D|nr:heterogeneous nuclear ribonucleoprotein 1-like [Andrographis paniculata]